MRVIPAIDIHGGKVVRLLQGRAELETIYSDSPLEVAKRWASYNVEILHVVDLDGALDGEMRNLEIIGRIAREVKVKVQLGGGLRDENAIKRALESGIDKVVLGTMALDDDFLKEMTEKYSKHIVGAIDAKEGIVYTKGWLFNTSKKAVDLARHMVFMGVKTINYTDISKDGMLEGPNISSLEKLLKAVNIDIVASGGVSNIEDVKKLKLLGPKGLKGIIIGKALYQNTVDLGEAVRVCSQNA